MKKLVLVVISVMLLLTVLIVTTGCSSNYEDKETDVEEYWGGGYFKIIEKWNGNSPCKNNYIVYAVDTKVMYYVQDNIPFTNDSNITPLYNSDGTIRVYEESTK